MCWWWGSAWRGRDDNRPNTNPSGLPAYGEARAIVTGDDIAYFKRVLAAGLVHSPCLEMGVGYDGPNLRHLVVEKGIHYVGTDMAPGPSVDVVANFEASVEDLRSAFSQYAPFGTVVAFNVLEHSFDPVTVLDNTLAVLRPGGTVVVLTPTVWPLHSFPIDCWRLNPDFYEQYGKRRGLELLTDYFEYVGQGKIAQYRLGDAGYRLPSPWRGRIRGLAGRAIHRVFNTHGRGMFFPSHVASACVMRRTASV